MHLDISYFLTIIEANSNIYLLSSAYYPKQGITDL